MKIILEKSELEQIKAILNHVEDVEQIVVSKEAIKVIRKETIEV